MDTARQPELPALTGLRFWAAFFILLNHLLLGFISRDDPWLKNLLSAAGVLGMDTFFVLSGFIIHYNYHAKLKDFSSSSLFEFFVARFSRLYPLFICLFLVDFFKINFDRNWVNPEEIWKSLLFFVTMSQSWFYLPISTGETIAYMYPRASISWSVSTEMLMYSCYPLLLLAFRTDRMGTVMRVALACAMTLLLSLGLRWLNNHMDSVDEIGVQMFGQQSGIGRSVSYSFAFWFVFASPYVRVFEFVIGAMTAHLFLTLHDKPVTYLEKLIMPTLGLASLLCILGSFLPENYAIAWVRETIKIGGYYPPLAVIIFVVARYGDSLLNRFFSVPAFVYLGERSYSIYLIHIYVYSFALHFSAVAMPTVLRITLLWAIVFGAAQVLYRVIEMPARRKVRDIFIAAYPVLAKGWRNVFAKVI